MEAVPAEPPVNLDTHHKPRRSKAVPKHSLFGTDLELLSDAEKAELLKKDFSAFNEQKMKHRIAVQNKYKPDLPADLKGGLPAKHVYDESCKELAKQEKEAKAAHNALDSLEKNSRFFQVGLHGDPSRSPRRSGPGSAVNNGLDSDNWRGDSNILGLKHSVNQSRQPSREQAPQSSGQKMEKSVFSNELYAYRRHRGPDWLPKEYFMRTVQPDPNIKGVDLPRNIQHQFGTDICRNVLGDNEKVLTSIERQRNRKAFINRQRKVDEAKRQPSPKQTGESTYESLGHYLRQDFFPGRTSDNKMGVIKEDFNDEVFKRRAKDPDEWRFQRDELSIWREHDVINQQMKRKWKEYDESKPQFQPNWDRNAKRPPPVPKPPNSDKKPIKPKPKPVKKGIEKTSSSPFEDVIFKTPPLTPPPPKPEPTERPASFTRDDEFWNFYDQSVPK